MTYYLNKNNYLLYTEEEKTEFIKELAKADFDALFEEFISDKYYTTPYRLYLDIKNYSLEELYHQYYLWYDTMYALDSFECYDTKSEPNQKN